MMSLPRRVVNAPKVVLAIKTLCISVRSARGFSDHGAK
jgi:hypothetical protein